MLILGDKFVLLNAITPISKLYEEEELANRCLQHMRAERENQMIYVPVHVYSEGAER